MLHGLHAEGAPFWEDVAAAAARGGHADCLAFALSVTPPRLQHSLLLCREILRSDHASCLSVLLDVFPQPLSDPESRTLCVVAAQHGALRCLRVLARRMEMGGGWEAEAMEAAAHGGHLHVLKYLHARRWTWPEVLWTVSLECLVFVRENGPWERFCVQCAHEAAARGQLDCLRYAVQEGAPLRAEQLRDAVHHGHLSCVVFLMDHACPIEQEDLCTVAAAQGHLACLRFLSTRGLPLSAYSAYAAAQGGHVDCLRYVHEHVGPDALRDVCWVAAVHGHIACLRYAHVHGAPWGDSWEEGRYVDAACLKYARTHGAPCDVAVAVSQLLPAVICPWAAAHGVRDCLLDGQESCTACRRRWFRTLPDKETHAASETTWRILYGRLDRDLEALLHACMGPSFVKNVHALLEDGVVDDVMDGLSRPLHEIQMELREQFQPQSDPWLLLFDESPATEELFPLDARLAVRALVQRLAPLAPSQGALLEEVDEVDETWEETETTEEEETEDMEGRWSAYWRKRARTLGFLELPGTGHLLADVTIIQATRWLVHSATVGLHRGHATVCSEFFGLCLRHSLVSLTNTRVIEYFRDQLIDHMDYTDTPVTEDLPCPPSIVYPFTCPTCCWEHDDLLHIDFTDTQLSALGPPWPSILRAREKILAAAEKAHWDPAFAYCRRRLHRDFAELMASMQSVT